MQSVMRYFLCKSLWSKGPSANCLLQALFVPHPQKVMGTELVIEIGRGLGQLGSYANPARNSTFSPSAPASLGPSLETQGEKTNKQTRDFLPPLLLVSIMVPR